MVNPQNQDRWVYAQMKDPQVRDLVLFIAMEDNIAEKWALREEAVRKQYLRLVRM